MAETDSGIFRAILKGNIDFKSEPWPSISDGAKDLIRKMLDRSPKQRITAHEVLCEPLICLIVSILSWDLCRNSLYWCDSWTCNWILLQIMVAYVYIALFGIFLFVNVIGSLDVNSIRMACNIQNINITLVNIKRCKKYKKDIR